MKRVGIGGFQLADVNYGQGQTVEPKTPYGSPEWYDAVHYAAAEADRLGLEMAIFSSPGWSETGGPWVTPAGAMKKLVWSETTIEGPLAFSGVLPQPPSNNGQIRNAGLGPSAAQDPTFYGDTAVVAYRAKAEERASAVERPHVTTSGGAVDGGALLDDDLNSMLTIQRPADGGPAWVQFEYADPFTARAITLGGRGTSGNGIPVGRVLASDDGENFRTLVTLPGAQLYRQGRVRTFAFPATTARFFRIEMTGAPLGPAATMSEAAGAPAAQYILSEAVLHHDPRVNRWEEKAGFSFLFEYESDAAKEASADAATAPDSVIDLTAKMKPDGTLDWQVPAGRWTVLRLGYSLTGAKNRPATSAGSGYEADKLSREHMEAYFHGYFDPLANALGPLFGKSLRYVMMDSWEAGTNNWTENILREFQRRRGYDPAPYLPALTGRVVESADVSDRFLWDFRRTLADLWAENHYGTMSELLRRRGIGIYAEAAGVSLEMPEDTLLNKSKVEIPMGEFWVRDLHPRLMYLQDVRGAASAAHVYGKKLVAAEAFTGGGFESPYTLKKVADYWFAQGVNRLVFHTSAHQPLDTKPGNAMVGTHLHRNITWAEQAAPFITYLARSSFLLQQGRPVADIAYLLNEGAPSTPPIWGEGTTPAPPEGYDYDFINADVLLHRLTVAADGRLLLPDGMSYRLLVLPETTRMRPELARKLAELVRGGATIVGAKPERSPSLMEFPKADEELHAITADLWGDLDGVSRTIRFVGKGRVVWGRSLAGTLAALGVAKDFEYSRGLDTELVWAHRRTDSADIYYVANITDQAENLDARFRVEGKEAELWHPDSGEWEPAGFSQASGLTTVPLRLAGRESAFVVFRKPSQASSREGARETFTAVASLGGDWELSFPDHAGAPPHLRIDRLNSWTENSDPGVAYFSGTARYSKIVNASPDWFRAGASLFLDLGDVRDIAEVSVNGKALGTLWKPPYRLELSDALRPGENRIEIAVTNQWTNRLLGDVRLPVGEKILGGSPVSPGAMGAGPQPAPPVSGLLGPVRILARTSPDTAKQPLSP